LCEKYKNPKIIPPDMKNVGWKVSINCLIYAHKQTKTLSGGIFNSPVWLLSEEKGEEGRKSMEYVLELKNIYKSFPGVKVLEDVTLQVRPGEVHALMGENGAGKSTLMKILMGIYKADQGSIFLEGKETVIHGPKDAMSKGISMIHQELNTVLDMEVAENVFVGRELLKKGFEKLKIVDIARMREETGKYFREMNIDIDPRAKMRTLSVAEMQLVEIVKAISLNSRIIVMDEPTSAITEKEATVLFAQIERLKKQGVAIIYISHKMDEIFRISDTITVLRDGQWIGTKPAKELDNDMLIKMMVGRELTDIYPKDPVEIGDVILEVKNLSRGKKVRDASFSLRKGEVLGIAGLVGAGRSELVETIFGLYPKTGGQIFLHGKEVHIKSAADAIKNKMALITEDRKQTGLNLIVSVKENIASVSIGKLSNHGIVNDKKINEVSEKYIKELKIKTPDGNAIVGNLSGGNQQKVVLAKWLLDEPDIIIFDEPTRGIDIGAKRDIYLLINNLAKEGKAVIVISSEMAEVMGICDRILVMAEGRINGEVRREEFSQEVIMGYASNITGGKQE
jgi:ABC-type sugar transport system ATPase subunit